jgi:hypothetical protein
MVLAGTVRWQCPACDHQIELQGPAGAEICECVVCGSHELYKKKDFPHGLGMAILVVACVISFITYGWYEKWLTWAILIGTAVFDGMLYLLVGDAAVCYRCHAHYRGIPKRSALAPFDLGTAERYRQERLRRELLQAEQNAKGVKG